MDMSPNQPSRAAGSYGMAAVFLHPWHLWRLPPAAASQADLAAVQGGEARRVVCFLRGTYAPFPSKLCQGWLDLTNDDAQWKPLLKGRQPAQQIAGPIESVQTRRADGREPGVPQTVRTPPCEVVTCQTPSGSFDLVVPHADVPLVVGYFSRSDQPASLPA